MKFNDIRSSEITEESLYLDRQRFIANAGLLGVAAAAGALPACLNASRRGDAATS